MKCQSDYGTETDALLRQTDDCTEEWWEEEPQTEERSLIKEMEDDESALIVKTEIRRRGLVQVSEENSL